MTTPSKKFQHLGDRAEAAVGRTFDPAGMGQTPTSAPRPMSVADAIITSIAWVHCAAVVTRNVRDFENCGIHLMNPYDPIDGRSK